MRLSVFHIVRMILYSFWLKCLPSVNAGELIMSNDLSCHLQEVCGRQPCVVLTTNLDCEVRMFTFYYTVVKI